MPAHVNTSHVCGVCSKVFPIASQLDSLGDIAATHATKQSRAAANPKIAERSASKRKARARTHTGDTSHQCQYCPMTFGQSSKLSLHERTHTGEKPHQCEQRPMRFARSDSLTLHMRSHTGERPHQCQYCTSKFSGRTKRE